MQLFMKFMNLCLVLVALTSMVRQLLHRAFHLFMLHLLILLVWVIQLLLVIMLLVRFLLAVQVTSSNRQLVVVIFLYQLFLWLLTQHFLQSVLNLFLLSLLRVLGQCLHTWTSLMLVVRWVEETKLQVLTVLVLVQKTNLFM